MDLLLRILSPLCSSLAAPYLNTLTFTNVRNEFIYSVITQVRFYSIGYVDVELYRLSLGLLVLSFSVV